MKLFIFLISIFSLFGISEVLAQSNNSVEIGTKKLHGSKGLKLDMKSESAKETDQLVGRWNGIKKFLVRGQGGKVSFATDYLVIKNVTDNKYTVIKHSIFPDGTEHEHEATEYVLSDGILSGVGSKLRYSGIDSKLMSKDQIISVLGDKLIYKNEYRSLNDVDNKIGYIK